MRDELFASRIFGVADIVEQFENQRSQNRVIVRVDQPRKQRTAGEIDDFRVARLETGECALVTDREHLSALHRDRRSDRRACERPDRPAAQNDVGAFARRQGGSGAAGGERRSRADRIGHERASAGHAHRLAEQAGQPAGVKLIAEKELVETPTTHIKASRAQQARYGTCNTSQRSSRVQWNSVKHIKRRSGIYGRLHFCAPTCARERAPCSAPVPVCTAIHTATRARPCSVHARARGGFICQSRKRPSTEPLPSVQRPYRPGVRRRSRQVTAKAWTTPGRRFR